MSSALVSNLCMQTGSLKNKIVIPTNCLTDLLFARICILSDMERQLLVQNSSGRVLIGQNIFIQTDNKLT